MFENVSKYWPALSLIALSVVSVFNIGYFSAIGYHFIGIMDLSNIAYPIGLVLGVFFGFGVFLSRQNIENLNTIANSDKSPAFFRRWSKIFLPVLIALFTLGLFNSWFISIMGLFSLYFAIAFVLTYLFAAMSYLRHGRLTIEWISSLIFVTVLTVSFYGGYVAQQQAYYAKTKYNVVTKSGGFSDVRIVRTSSTGFLISKDRTIMFIPSGEVRFISTISDP